MKVLDLFSGLGGWNQAFKDRGHEVITVDIERKFNPTITIDINDLMLYLLKPFGRFDLVLASPPCNCFSVASCYRHWNKNGTPKDIETFDAINLVKHTLKLIENLNPKWWILENPRGMLRKVIGAPTAFITQCQYGREIMKPTDLWGKLPQSFEPKSCKNNDKCHEQAPRGSKYGVQGIGINLEAFKKHKFAYMVKGGGNDSSLRAKIPYGLSLAVCSACEKELQSCIET